jgi:hypothetical protein
MHTAARIRIPTSIMAKQVLFRGVLDESMQYLPKSGKSRFHVNAFMVIVLL